MNKKNYYHVCDPAVARYIYEPEKVECVIGDDGDVLFYRFGDEREYYEPNDEDQFFELEADARMSFDEALRKRVLCEVEKMREGDAAKYFLMCIGDEFMEFLDEKSLDLVKGHEGERERIRHRERVLEIAVNMLISGTIPAECSIIRMEHVTSIDYCKPKDGDEQYAIVHTDDGCDAEVVGIYFEALRELQSFNPRKMYVK